MAIYVQKYLCLKEKIKVKFLCSYVLLSFEFIVNQITALTIPTKPKTINTAPVILFNMLSPFSLNSLVLTKLTNRVRVNHHIVAPNKIDAIPTILKNGSVGFTILNRANNPINKNIIIGLLKHNPNAVI